MRVASLYSGGKDSTFSLFKAREIGYDIACLIIMHPSADDSMLFHYPNSWVAKYLADAMQIDSIGFTIKGASMQDELKVLEEAIINVKSLYDIQGIIYGGISSKFQNNVLERICSKHKLTMITPLWHMHSSEYMHELLNKKFHIKIVSVSAMGLNKDWLGRSLDENSLTILESLSKKYGFNLTFEGGEAETLVVDCPLFKKKVDIKKASIHWDGQRGIFEILEVILLPK
jgi:diphthine-ammonia ligase